MGLLETNGLSLEILAGLSYQSQLGKSLKNNLHAFEKAALLQDALDATEWFDANELLGFRALCTSYDEALHLDLPSITVVDMSHGKAHDDGYRGVHLYYKKDNFHYPIELQFNTFIDRQLNDWLHDYVYKKNYPASVGCALRTRYEHGSFTELESFEEALHDVLSDCKR